MQNRYLLYIDILGFSNYVKKDTMQVHRIYKIIEDLNAHHHDAFRVIVFSDTILIYNIVEPLTEYDKSYYVMFMIEFAQNRCLSSKLSPELKLSFCNNIFINKHLIHFAHSI